MKKKIKRTFEVSLQDLVPDETYMRLKKIQRELMGQEKNYGKHRKR